MKRLTHNEGTALSILAKRGALVPGDSIPDWSEAGLMHALNGLVKKRLALAEETDDGPRFTCTAEGRAYAT